MTYPKMIIFDYGQTLLCEPDFNIERGTAELFKYVSNNPYNISLNGFREICDNIHNNHIANIRNQGYDVGMQAINRIICEITGLSFSLSPLDMEMVFWDAVSIGDKMPSADIMIDYINQCGIRTAVISNLIYSSDALAKRFNRLLSNNNFEFVMTSSDYLFRKPNKTMFEIAIKKSGLQASDIWYCGDNVIADIEAASSVGIFPVWYDNNTDKNKNDIKPNCEHLHIHKWDELIKVLESNL